MTRRRNDEKASSMYEAYKSGKSLSEVAIEFGVTRQCVYDMFKVRGYKLRTMQQQPFVMFNGRKYSRKPNGYFYATTGKRTLLHRDVWEHHNGKMIPEGWDIHHVDENKENNSPENLECLPKSEHTRLYSPHNNQYTKGRKRAKSS